MALCDRCEYGEKFRAVNDYYICHARRCVVLRDKSICFDFKRDEKKVKK